MFLGPRPGTASTGRDDPQIGILLLGFPIYTLESKNYVLTIRGNLAFADQLKTIQVF